MIPEFLSLYETERLIQELDKNEMDVINIVVNQILFAKGGIINNIIIHNYELLMVIMQLYLDNCLLCSTRSKMQNKYLTQVDTLYPS